MPKLLVDFVPCFLYTYVPERVASKHPDATTYIQDNVLHTLVNGGGTYEHEIWNYETDVLTIDYWWGSLIYHVEQRILDNQRRIVYLLPARKVYGPFAWILPGRRLIRCNYTFQGVNLIRSQIKKDDNTHTMISLGQNGQRFSLDCPEDIFTAAMIRCNLAKEPSISDVERIFRAHNLENPDLAAAIFIQCYKLAPKALSTCVPTLTVPKWNEKDTITYQTLSPLVMEDGKPCARTITRPILPTGRVPARSFNNDNACIQGRVLNVRNPNAPIPPFYRQCREEFLEFFIPRVEMHTYAPMNEAYVESMQNRPTQRHQAERAKPFAGYLKFIVKAFQKAEVYGKINYPRNISTVPTDHKLRFSAFVYSLAPLMKRCDWYAFSLNPKQVTERIRNLVSTAESITSNDFSFYDGTHGDFKHETERMLFMRAFALQYHNEAEKLLGVMRNAPAITTHELRYNTGTGLISGAADTSFGNTLIDALIAYIALRMRYDPNTSWTKLGLYGGDDNLNIDIPAELHVKVATKLGYRLKTTTIARGSPVPFLGRVFLDPWTTDASVCDIPRRMRSLHITVSPNTVPREAVLYRKAESYLITDSNTPVISNWSKLVLRSFRKSDAKYDPLIRNDLPYQINPENNWTSPDETERAYAMYLAARDIGVDVTDLQALCDGMDACQHIDQLDVKFEVEPTVVIPAVVNGQIVT
jgi:hypothetical protein